MKRYGIINWRTFEKDMRGHGLYAEGFARDIESRADESGAKDGEFFEVETGRKNACGSWEVVRFSVLNHYEFDEDGDVINDLIYKYECIF